MANWCSNTITFSGTPDKIKPLETMFKKMVKLENETNHGQLPFFMDKAIEGWFHDIYIQEVDTNEPDHSFIAVQYSSKYNPNIDDCVFISETLKLDFVLCYEETGNYIYGEVKYENGIVQVRDLEEEDFKKAAYYVNNKIDATSDEAVGPISDLSEEQIDKLDEDGWYEDTNFEKLDELLEEKEWTAQ